MGPYSFGRLRAPASTTRPVLPKRSRFAQSTFTTWSPRKRDAATSLLQRLYAHMKLLDVDFVGGDFNMAVKRANGGRFQRCRIHGTRIVSSTGSRRP